MSRESMPSVNKGNSSEETRRASVESTSKNLDTLEEMQDAKNEINDLQNLRSESHAFNNRIEDRMKSLGLSDEKIEGLKKQMAESTDPINDQIQSIREQYGFEPTKKEVLENRRNMLQEELGSLELVTPEVYDGAINKLKSLLEKLDQYSNVRKDGNFFSGSVERVLESIPESLINGNAEIGISVKNFENKAKSGFKDDYLKEEYEKIIEALNNAKNGKNMVENPDAKNKITRLNGIISNIDSDLERLKDQES
jgi:hypothetical protein